MLLRFFTIEQILTGIAETYNGVLNTLISNITIEGIPDEKWVPCIERLPENRDDVLVWFEYFRYGEYNRMYQTYGIGNFYGKHGKREEWLINHETGWQNLRVLAWMPMPKPSGSRRQRMDFKKYPKYKENYIRAFGKMLIARKEAGLTNTQNWNTGMDVFKWWLGEDVNQLTMFDEDELTQMLWEMETGETSY